MMLFFQKRRNARRGLLNLPAAVSLHQVLDDNDIILIHRCDKIFAVTAEISPHDFQHIAFLAV